MRHHILRPVAVRRARRAGDEPSEKDAKLAQKLANFSLLLLHFHRNAWANLHLSAQPNTFLAPVGQTEDAGMPEVAIDLNGCSPSEGQAMWACTAQGNQAKLARATLSLRAHLQVEHAQRYTRS